MEALMELLLQQQGPLFAYLYRMCGDADQAEELMQETLLRALRAAERCRPETNVKSWLLSIATNLLRDQWRRKKRWGAFLSLEEWHQEAPDTVDDEVLRGLDCEQVRRALLDLPLEHRSVILLRYYHDMSYEEIARALAVPIGTVRSRIHNGLQRLRRLLTAEVVTR
ncbi:MAG: polymerase sigma factor SigY [Symbiobacteriaceae bacterium]|jgi:RNA polymerase sigma-70 factor (ECF subfamily)|nr:polymerase sigma factor SigY [Symbiobacteriaceae bacterium]